MKTKTHKTLYPPEYPDLLQRIRPIPKSLNVIGAIPPDDHLFLCVVGSRTPSNYGKEACRHLILGLRGQKIVIVSGLAHGIDSIAHEAALDAGLPTIAFPGSGLSFEILYPSAKRALAERIVDSGGALISPFKPQQPGTHWTFPMRNRLMAGISHALLIVEGMKGSGTFGTATYALEFNRHIMIVPGSIFSPLSYGPQLLYKDGAAPVASAEDIMQELDFITERLARAPRGPERLAETLNMMKLNEEQRVRKAAVSTSRNPPKIDLSTISLSPEEQTIMNLLSETPIDPTELIERSSLKIQTLNVVLTELELKGLLLQEMGTFKRA